MSSAPISYTIHPKENFYLYLKVIVCLLIYPGIFYGLYLLFSSGITPQAGIFVAYASLILLFIIIQMGLLIGYLKGNAIKISENQLPDIYEIVKHQSAALGMATTPQVYLVQVGGALNAFATSFMGTNYVVIYSDILEEAYENNIHSVEFIVGHELGHVKRKHVLKRLILFPSFIIPFLSSAYSRACEYTCDNIGAALSPKGARNGLLILASGKRLYSKINVEQFALQMHSEGGFWAWLSEKTSSHPKLARRVAQFRGEEFNPEQKKANVPLEKKEMDHSAYLPR